MNIHQSPVCLSRLSIIARAVRKCFDGHAVLTMIGVLVFSPAGAQVARIPVNALPTGPATQALVPGTALRQPQVIAGNFNPYTVSGNTATITQTDTAGILRWGKFDIGAGATVVINQPDSSAVLLNKVDGGDYLNKTVIEGILTGNKGGGQVYIYNPNGIIFGKNSTVDLNTLVATTLKIDESRFLAGVMAPNTAPIFSVDPTTGAATSSIMVEGAVDGQARITAGTGGKIILVAPTVTNNGVLSAVDGQVILAAGGSVYLARPSDVSMRGLVVEVSNANIAGGSTATNDTLGKIPVGRGNASLVGLAVNQMGTVSATTSVSLNGSIYLRARDGASKSSASEGAVASNGGQLTLGENSVTTVTPTLDDASTVPSTSKFNKSQIDLSGKTIHLQQGASVVAKGGDITVQARSNPSLSSAAPAGGARIYLDAGASIDASGTTSELAMESNVIAVQLRGSELADSPMQRDSALRGKTVMIDIRKGTPLANVSGYLALVEKNVGQLTAAGGSVTLAADSDVIVNSGASIDVSGGQVNYRSGYVATSQLTSFGRTVDIGSASPTGFYTGVLDAAPGPRNFEAGYSQGSSAGSIYFNAPNLVVRGNLKGAATPGAKQRDISAADYPLGGQIVIGSSKRVLSDELIGFTAFNFLGRVDFGGTSTKDVATPGFAEAWDSSNAGHRLLQSTLDIDNAAMANNGFSRINAYTQGDIVVSKPLDLPAGGELRLAAQSKIEFDSGVKIPGGTIEAVSATSQISVAPGSALNVAGLWTNDKSLVPPARDSEGNPTAKIVTSGGSIALQGQTVDIGGQTTFDVSGGAWQNSSGKIKAGSGGNISIVSTPTDNTLPESARLSLGDAVEFRGYGMTTGGTLKLTGRDVVLGASAGDPSDLGFVASFFQQGGFAKYDINAQRNLTVEAGATIHPVMDNWVVRRDTATLAGGRMADSFDIATLPLAGVQGSRGASSIVLGARSELVDGAGRLWIKPGASVVTDPGGAITLKAGRQLTVDGSVLAKGGTISALLYQTLSASVSGYRPERSIWLGTHSLIDAGGSDARVWTNSQGLSNGEVLDGGSILIGGIDGTGKIVAVPGYVVAESGSKLDVSGVAASMSLRGSRGNVLKRTVASAGGSIDIRAAEGLLLEGSLAGAGGDGSVSGGSLVLTLDRGTIVAPSGFPTAARDFEVLRVKPNAGTATEGIVPVGLQADQAINGVEGKGYVLADTLNHSGFDRVSLKSQDVLGFDAGGTSLALNTRTALSIDAPLFSVQNLAAGNVFSLSSTYARVGNSDWQYQAAAGNLLPTVGTAVMEVNADNIDLVGKSVLQGVSTTRFNANHDVRLVGQAAVDLTAAPPASPQAIHATGSFAVAGDLAFTASQLYPTTMSEFSLSASGNASHVEFHQNGVAPATPLSAAGTLSVTADNIVQDGIVRAPFGRISMNAADTLSYLANSVTSVAGSRNVPLGQINNGRDWLYDFGNGNSVVINSSTASNGFMLPQKAVISSAKSVSVASGARIDLAGGGDLYAYEFTPGPGGSQDVLAKNGVFAILPGFSGSLAPQDFQYQQGSGLKAGDRIYLSGMPGLSAGYYTLLPAHYALLAGAYSLSPASGTRDMSGTGNYNKPDGTWVVAGYRGTALSSDSRWSGFLLTSSEQIRTQSEFTDYSANTFFAGVTSNLPKNGGQIAFSATQSLMLNGLIDLGAASGGRRGSADISSPEIVVVSDAAQDAGTALKLTVADLSALGADSLMLGGIRDQQANGTQVTVGANKVTLTNDAAHPLSGPEIILAAKDEVKLSANSAISSNGVPGGSGGDLIINGSGSNADGALMRVSGGKQVAVIRNAPAGNKGDLIIETGANISATGSMNLDATRSLVNRATLGLDSGAALSLGANRISLGGGVPGTVDGLRFDGAALTALSSISDLSLTSYTTFDVYGNAVLGRLASGQLAVTKSLHLRGAGVQLYGSGDATFTLNADTVRFDGGGTFTPATGAIAASGSAGKMDVAAKDIEIGSGSFAVKGFKDVVMTAQREIRAVGKEGNLTAEKALTLAAGRITATTRSDASIKSGDKLTLTQVANPLAAVTTDALGGKLTFVGNSIVSDANIVAESGQIKLQAQGADGVHVIGGEIDASGYSRTFGSTVAYAPAGSISLDGGIGNVTVDSAAALDVSAIGADAGLLAVTANNGANGQAILNGTVKGGATAGVNGSAPNQGRFTLDSDLAGADFGALNSRLNSGAFTGSRSFRIRHDDVTLAAGSSIVAHDVTIAADDGNISVGGTISAQGAKGGSIALYAAAADAASGKGKVELQATARLDASATEAAASAAGSTGDGGRVVIGTSTANQSQPTQVSAGASISIKQGAVIDVSGRGAGQGGSVLLRAPRVSSNDDVAVTATDTRNDPITLNGVVVGASDFAIEGYKAYTATAINAADVETFTKSGTTVTGITPSGTYYDDGKNYLAAANISAIQSRLGTTVNLRAGIEVNSSTDLTVSVNEVNTSNPAVTTATNPQDRGWNLNAWRFGGQPGVLTLRAAGNLYINGSISDGFVKPASGSVAANKIGMPGWSLDPAGGASWSYRLAGGADLAAASPLATKASDTTGDVVLGFARTTGISNDQPVALIRTGTGSIDIAAGRDVTLSTLSPGSANAIGATIYTAGRHTALADGVVAPKKQTINTAYVTGTVNTAAEFAEGGGAININASRNVTGAATNQLINNWLFRRGRTTTNGSGDTVFASSGFGANAETQQSAWWSRYDYFNQGIATFGGGDITVVAERGNVTDVSLSTASSGQVGGSAPVMGSLVERGGGDIKVISGGDIRGGSYYVQSGQGSLRAGGSVTTSERTVSTADGRTVALKPVLELGDATISVVANQDVQIESAFNPTLTRQNSTNAVAVTSAGNFTSSAQFGYFSTYGQNSGVSVTAMTGNVVLGNDSAALLAASGPAISSPLASDVADYQSALMFVLYPGSMNVAALQGDISYQRAFTLAPRALGQFNLLAAGSVKSDFAAGSGGSVVMSDVDPARLPGVYSPRALSVKNDIDLLTYAQATDGIQFHTPNGLHSNDAEPVRIIAINGSISGDVNRPYTFILPKRAEILAGQDISNVGFKIQHLADGDVTRIEAGRDLIDSTSPVAQVAVTHQLSGPGRLDIQTGRNFDLGNGHGLATRGNLDNAYLPEQGSSINLLAGALADYANFFRSHVTLSDLSPVDQSALVAYVRALDPSVSPSLDAASALERFNALAATDKRAYLESHKPMLNDLFFTKVRLSSQDSNGGVAKDLSAFDALIASLYPASSVSGGDINVFGSQLKTERGGSINLFAPGGSVYAGLPKQPAWLAKLLKDVPASASEFGITSIRGGAVQSLVRDDFSVNQGRVFTLGGGDITLISQYGDIDAGRGAKTAVSAPPPVIKTDSKGNTVVDISGSIAGAGIATLRTDPSIPSSNVYPVAPRGIFDAGDAGVRSTGSVDIVAATVLNANNITAGGAISGAQASASGMSGAVAVPASAPLAKTDSAVSTTSDAKAAGSLSVELLGYGAGESPATNSEPERKGQQTVTQATQNDLIADTDIGGKKKKTR